MSKHKYKCTRCGYQVTLDRPPPQKVCPICGGTLYFQGLGRFLSRLFQSNRDD